MLIDIHMLQNHAPSNLNRDDTGSPKDCIFGGVRRSRISSQSIKRAIRRSKLFAVSFKENGQGVRTRQLPGEIKATFIHRGFSEEIAEVAAVKASGFGNKKGKETDDWQTAQMMYLTPADIRAVADVLQKAYEEAGSLDKFKQIGAAELQKRADLKAWRPITADVALFGRMITSDAFRDVESSVQVAHALSTHKMEHEFDYFTAVDDLKELFDSGDDKGAGMINDVEFTSACYYKYMSVDVDGMVDNLVGPLSTKDGSNGVESGDALKEAAASLARDTVLAFLQAATFSSPSGKQNTFAAHQLPDAILIEVKNHPIPVSYANAFVMPVRVDRQTTSSDLVSKSISALVDHVRVMDQKFSVPVIGRLWFTTRSDKLDSATECESFSILLEELKKILEAHS